MDYGIELLWLDDRNASVWPSVASWVAAAGKLAHADPTS